jgi:NitT/TauT family transport system substrate-binding protein
VAKEFGFFAKEGLDIDFLNVINGTVQTQLIAAGKLNFATSDFNAIANAREAGADVRAVVGSKERIGTIQCQPTFSATGAYPEVMKSLVGKSVGIPSLNSGFDYMLRYSLIDAGVDVDSVKIVGIGSIDSLANALRTKAVDCITAFQPAQASLKNESKTIVDWELGGGPAAYKDMAWSVWITPKAFADSNPEAVRAFARAIKSAVEFMADKKNAPAIAAKITQYFPGIELGVLAQVMEQSAPGWGWRITPAMVANSKTAYDRVEAQRKSGKTLSITFENGVAAPVQSFLSGK